MKKVRFAKYKPNGYQMKPNDECLKVRHKIVITIPAHGGEVCFNTIEDLLFTITMQIKHSQLPELFEKGG